MAEATKGTASSTAIERDMLHSKVNRLAYVCRYKEFGAGGWPFGSCMVGIWSLGLKVTYSALKCGMGLIEV